MDSARGAGGRLRVEVVYAAPGSQIVVTLDLEPGATAGDALLASGLARRFEGIDAASPDLGIFGRPVPPTTPIADGDRVEIYRPLEVDPRTARRRRAARRRG